MQIRVEKITYYRDPEGFWLNVRIPSEEVKPAMNWMASMDEGKEYGVSLDVLKKKRSLDSNAYCWVLIGKLANALCQPKSQIYRELVKDIGDNYDTVCVKNEALESLCARWEKHGLGWIAERFPSKLEGCTNVNLYYGSSEYDSKQMSRLIDAVVAECKENGIETATPEELERMKEEWR